MNAKEKQNEIVLFDASVYYGGLEEDLLQQTFEANEITGATEQELFEMSMFMKDVNLEYEMQRLISFFDGSKTENRPVAGNHVLVAGSASRWNGSSTGINIYPDFKSAIDTSPVRFGYENIFADCEFNKIWEEDGQLFISGAHHDGSVSVEIRQLSNEGEKVLCETLDSTRSVDFYELQFEAMGAIYKEGDENKFVHDLWNDPVLCPICRYVEREWQY